MSKQAMTFEEWWEQNGFKYDPEAHEWIARAAWKAAQEALQHDAEPVAWTEREIELFDGMIDVQKYHAEQCDRIRNRVMAEKQKGWDMERIALLNKCKAMLAAAPQPKEK